MINYIDNTDISNKRVLLRVDYNLSLNPDHTIADDARMQQTLPTINALLEKNNTIILVSHLGRPEGVDPSLSLKPIAERLSTYTQRKIVFIDDFLTKKIEIVTANQPQTIYFLENIRFHKEEETNDEAFSKELASLAEVYVNDAFSVSHRAAASIVGVTKFLPSFGGLLLKKEITMLSKVTENPQKPLVAILGGSKISTKLKLLTKLTELADTIILGGGLATTLLKAKGQEIGKSICEESMLPDAKRLLELAEVHHTELLLPYDAIVGVKDATSGTEKLLADMSPDDTILDIGPETEAMYAVPIEQARTLVWNGPMGYLENPIFARGTNFLYYAITANAQATSIVGGGETLAALKKKEHLEKISHISTGGGAMLEYIENGTLPGIQALDRP